jgi:hypothetical protein
MFSSCLYSATGKVVQFPVKGSCTGDNCHCNPFPQDIFMTSTYKFPIIDKQKSESKLIEGFDDKFLTPQQKYNRSLLNRQLTSPDFLSNQKPEYKEKHVRFLDKIHYDLHNNPLNKK